MIARGYVAAASALIILFGHVGLYFFIQSIDTISPSQKTEIQQLILPITAASVMTTVKWVFDNAKISLGLTEKGNFLFAIFAVIIPLFTFVALFNSLRQLNNDATPFEDVRTLIAAAEAFFGGIFVFVVNGIFGSGPDLQTSRRTQP